MNKRCKFTTIILAVLLILLVILLWWQKQYNEGFFSVEKIISLDDIDAFIYINLEKREDRKTQILAELDKLSIPSSKIFKVSGVLIPDNGHKGCIQSHILALNMAKLNGWYNIMIMEDDAEITVSPDEYKKQIKNMLDYLSATENEPQFDVLMLATANAKKKPVDKLNDLGDGLVHISSSTTSSAYIIKQHYYDKMIALFTYLNSMMDASGWSDGGHERFALDQNWQAMQERDMWYGWQNDIVRQSNSSSTINEYLSKI